MKKAKISIWNVYVNHHRDLRENLIDRLCSDIVLTAYLKLLSDYIYLIIALLHLLKDNQTSNTFFFFLQDDNTSTKNLTEA